MDKYEESDHVGGAFPWRHWLLQTFVLPLVPMAFDYLSRTNWELSAAALGRYLSDRSVWTQYASFVLAFGLVSAGVLWHVFRRPVKTRGSRPL